MYPDRKFIDFTRALLDILVIALAFSVAEAMSWPFGDILKVRHSVSILLALEALWLLSAQATHLYQDFRSRDLLYEMFALLKSVVALFVETIMVLFFVKQTDLSRSFVLSFALLSIVLLAIEKYAARKLLKSIRRRHKNLRNIVIVGAGRTGIEFAESVQRNPSFGYNLVGFLDDSRKDYLNGKYLGATDELEAVILARKINDVVVALPNQAHRKIESIVKLCMNSTARVRIIPDLRGLGLGSYELTTFGNLPIISFRRNSVNETHWRLAKRLFDILVSSLAFVLIFSWLWPILLVCQKLFNKGPVFYRARRWGRDGREFYCYKFRSMVPNSENIDCNGSHQFTKRNDSRVTRFGSFLRRTNLDELPQFINVLKGEMSIVGPRPHDSSENAKLKEVVDSYMWRHVVKPGITGWAQVNGLRGGTDNLELMKRRTICDIWYIENWSLWLDIQIIIKTMWQTLKGDPHAY